MITLDKDKSMLLAIVKGWEHVEVPIERDRFHDVIEDRHEYIKRVCAHRCGCKINHVDMWGIYAPLGELLLTSRELIRAFEYCVPNYHCWTNTPLEALFSALMMVKVREDHEVLVDMDMTDVISSTERKKELIAIQRWEAGEVPMMSTGICDTLQCGYGELDNNGYWEYTLPYKYWGNQ